MDKFGEVTLLGFSCCVHSSKITLTKNPLIGIFTHQLIDLQNPCKSHRNCKQNLGSKRLNSAIMVHDVWGSKLLGSTLLCLLSVWMWTLGGKLVLERD